MAPLHDRGITSAALQLSRGRWPFRINIDVSRSIRSFRGVETYGTRDTVADVEKILATRANLPAGARMVPIAGGNHSQLGYYGFKLGDWPATIAREEQQRQTLEALLATLSAAAGR